jgi:hypothetical protein
MNLNELQDQMAVLAAIQLKQTEIQKLQAEELDAVRTGLAAVRATTDELQREFDLLRATSAQRMAEWDQRIEKLVSGFGAFLSKAQH